MRTVEFDLIHTLLLAMVVLFAGRGLVARIGVLQRFSIPAPVVGGGLVAILLALADGLGGIKLSFNMAMKDSLLLMFFTTVGLAADARMLTKGGVKLLVFLGISAALVVVQNIVGLGAALALDLHPVIGLFGGYEATYGSLAGVMVALLFFFVAGLGVVAGAELNAALVEPGGKAVRGEHYEGPYEAELPVEEPAPEEEQAAALRQRVKGV